MIHANLPFSSESGPFTTSTPLALTCASSAGAHGPTMRSRRVLGLPSSARGEDADDAKDVANAARGEATEVGDVEEGGAVAAVLNAEDREERDVLVDGKAAAVGNHVTRR